MMLKNEVMLNKWMTQFTTSLVYLQVTDLKTKRKKGVKTEKKYGKKEAIDASKRRQCQRVVVEKIKGI